MPKKRVLWVDAAKGVAMAAVVLGHTYYGGVPAHTFVYSFHIPLFFILAGYTFRVKPAGEMFKASVKRLLVPYLVLCLITAICDIAFGRLSIDGIVLFLGSVVFASGGSWLPFDIPSIGVPWFLMALFVARLLYNALLGFLDRHGVHPIVQFAVFAAICYAAKIAIPYIALPFALLQAVIAMFFMHAGHCMAKYHWIEKAPAFATIIALVLWAAGLALGFFFSIGNLWFVKSFVGGAVMAAAGSWCIMQACRFVEAHARRLGDILAFVGINSLLVLELHVVENLCFDWGLVVIEPLGWFSPVLVGIAHLAFVFGILWLVSLNPVKIAKTET